MTAAQYLAEIRERYLDQILGPKYDEPETVPVPSSDEVLHTMAESFEVR